MSAVFFVASLIHVPIGPSAAHLVLNGLCGVLLGWAAVPAIFVGLSLQALLFQFGGLTTLGVNTFVMAAPAVIAYYFGGLGVNSPNPFKRRIVEFLVGASAIAITAVFAGLALFETSASFLGAVKLILAAHIPIMIVEGFITMFILEFLRRVKPEILPGYSPQLTGADMSHRPVESP